jgi:acetate kinase
MDVILVVNAGSSSIKFQIFGIADAQRLNRLLKGQMDGIGSRPRFVVTDANQSTLIDQNYPVSDAPDVATSISIVADWLRKTQSALTLVCVGHRVVHGGPEFDRPVIVDEGILKTLERLSPLAPLHQPSNLAPIRSLLARRPELPQVACFDTAFHRGHEAVADHFAIPMKYYAEGVRRYGFHGLSYEYVSQALRDRAPEVAKGRVIVAHLGSGASMCAMANGRSVESTMGFTALDGLPMGTRPGQIDPGVLLYWIIEKGMKPEDVQNLLYRDSGLKGLSGISNDMRELQANDDPCAKLAVDHFVYRAGLFAGMLAASLGGLDAFVFTAGVGENSALVRERVAEKLRWLGAELDQDSNTKNKELISTGNSRVKLLVVPTDEEQMIARHTLALLSETSSRQRVRKHASST